MTTRASNNDTFALEVWCTMPKLKNYARRLWSGNVTEAEDGMSETVCRALSKQHQFRGGNLAAWLTHVMRNIRRDQLSKGYRKGGKKPDAARAVRLVFRDDALNARVLTDLCDPESIYIAREQYCDHIRAT